ncbi:amidase domain-containing protein [Galbitalea sp. SE-J8]|uniref:amidase domain-containing protein n=1 Tax=Galbitalea sp. SE-J8 TaxID=3054952 RepID=UPI00259CFBCB|nr:amidase domain-containing protein [Galbitalea sp. SE-J8]MDM4763699.1 amidase domain-containing protein [Galbitalea sp. SE-J8]
MQRTARRSARPTARRSARRAVAAFAAALSLALTALLAPTAANAEPPRRLPETHLKQNHALHYEKQCGRANGRFAWRGTKGVQCHLMDTGAIVALHRGRAFDRSRYTGTPVEKQLKYIADYWHTTGPADRFGYIPNENCANFVSQTLVARGWRMTKNWYYRGGRHSPSFTSSTELGQYLRLKGAVKLTDSTKNRKRVRVGDIVQFDWERDGKTNHSAVITRIVKKKHGVIKIFVAESADPYQYRSMNQMIHRVHPGGKAWFWRLPDDA